MKLQTTNYKLQTTKQGVSIYLALVIMFILLAIGLGVSLIIVSQMKMIRGMGNSVVAFYAADTGIEHALYNYRIQGGDGQVSGSVGGADYQVTSPTAGTYQSKGSFAKVKRAIKISYPISEIRFMRSDQQTVNGLTAYILGTAQSASALSVANNGASVGLEATLRPSGDSLKGFPEIYPSIPTTHYDKVDEATADDASTYIATGDSTTVVQDRYTKPAFSLPAGKKIAMVRVVCRGMTESLTATKQAWFRFGIDVGGTAYWSAYERTDDAWTTYSQDWTKNPTNNLQWTEADITNLMLNVAGKSYYSLDYYHAYITQIYLEVYTYTDNTAYYAIDVVKRISDGTETVLGSKVAEWSGLISSLYDAPGLKSATWGCPSTSLVSTDAVVVRVYQKVGAGAWNLTREFITEQLGATTLNAASWTVYYYLDQNTSTTVVNTVYWHGTTTYDSRIENFVHH